MKRTTVRRNNPGNTDVTIESQDTGNVSAHAIGQCETVAPVLARIGDKWSMLVVMLLGPGPRRFNELKRAVDGISQRMLSLTLRRLERDGLVDRVVTPTIPPRVDYSLTDLGLSLRAAVETLGAWAHDNHAAMTAAQDRYEARRREEDRIAGSIP